MPAAVPPTPSNRVVQLRVPDRNGPPVPAFERRVAMFAAFLVAAALFMTGLAPGLLVGTVIGSCAIGELSVAVDEVLLLRNPPAEVHELRRQG